MSPARVEKWTWVLIFGGLIACGLGLAVQPADAALGWVLVSAGAVAALAGMLLIWVRSRMRDGS
jgi:hypothetical protein